MKSKALIVGLFFVVALISLAGSIMTGAVRISPSQLIDYIGGGGESQQALILNLRIARVLSAFFAGGILALAGLLYQTVFQNPLVDSYVLGVASGAAFGGVLFIRLGTSYPFLGAFVFALLATFITLYLGRHNGGLSLIKTLLGGVVVGSFLGAATTFLLLTWKGPLYGGAFWFLGNFTSATMSDSLKFFLLTLVYLIAFLIFHRSLDVLLLGEEEATSLGLQVVRFRLFLLIVSAIAVSLVSSRFGALGFIGLIAPHICRLIAGPLHSVLLPLSILLGGSLLVVSDTIARTAFAPTEIPVGVLTVLLGGPFFLYLLRRKV